MLALYHADHSVCAQKVRLALAEKDIVWESRFLDLMAGDQHEPEYRRINPNALVPAIEHDGRVLLESTVINEYLDDAFRDPPLRPATPLARARMRLWTKQLDEGLHVATGVVSFAVAFRHVRLQKETMAEIEASLEHVPDPARRARQRDTIRNGVESPYFAEAFRQFIRLFDDMEKALSQTRWLAGDSFSLADIAYIPYLTRFENMAFLGMLDGRPRLATWYERTKARPSYKTAILHWSNAEKLALMHRSGVDAWPKAKALLAA